jgi:class 3 adenylate cyclase
MGVALAAEARRRGADVTLLAANLAVPPPPGVEVVETPSAEDVAREALAAEARLGGEVCDAAVLFVDLVGSTTLATQEPPERVVARLNGFFAVIVDVVARHGGVDIVYSNAAARLAPGTPWAELVGPFVETNNLATTRILRAFGPLLRPRGRLLVVASAFGSLRRLPTRLHGYFDTDAMSLADLDTTMLAWRDAVMGRRHARRSGLPGARRHRRVATMVRQHGRCADPRGGGDGAAAPRPRSRREC